MMFFSSRSLRFCVQLSAETAQPFMTDNAATRHCDTCDVWRGSRLITASPQGLIFVFRLHMPARVAVGLRLKSRGRLVVFSGFLGSQYGSG